MSSAKASSTQFPCALQVAAARKALAQSAAGANTAEMIVAEDAGCVAVSKRDLNGVIANRRGRFARAA